jgi:hypothetical protein
MGNRLSSGIDQGGSVRGVFEFSEPNACNRPTVSLHVLARSRDMLHRNCYKTAAQFATAAGNWVDAVQAAGRVAVLTKVMWVNGATYCQQNQPGYNTALDTLASQKGVGVIDMYADSLDQSSYYGGSGDPHPNETGCSDFWNAKLAEYMLSL